MHLDFLEGRHPTSIASNFADNNFEKKCRTTMSDVKLCQESIPHVFIAWKSLYSDLFAKFPVTGDHQHSSSNITIYSDEVPEAAHVQTSDGRTLDRLKGASAALRRNNSPMVY